MITAQSQHGTSEQWTFPAWTRPPALWWGWGSLVFFTALLIDAMMRPRAFFDVRLMQLVQGIEAPGLVTLVRRVNELTSTSGAIAAWALALVVFALARWWVPVLALFTLPAGGIVNEGIGLLLVSRTRPHLPELARTSSNYQEHSFPSGHVTGAVLLYGLIFVIVGRIRHTMLLSFLASFLISVRTGISDSLRTKARFLLTQNVNFVPPTFKNRLFLTVFFYVARVKNDVCLR